MGGFLSNLMSGFLRNLQIFFVFFFANSAFAQNSDFVRPQKAIKGFQNHILLTSYDDFVYFKAHLPQFSAVERLRIDGTVDVALLSEVASKLDELEELQLRNFQGILSDADLEYLEWIPNVYVYVPQNREDAILQNNYWKKFQTISLEFEVVPDQFDFVSTWKKCKELQLIAPWKKNEADAALKEIAQYLPNIQKLSISLDVMRDLPASVRLFKKLKKLTIIDKAALNIGIPVEQLYEIVIPVKIGEKDVPIGFGVNKSSVKKAVTMPLVYLTNENSLLNHELKQIKKIFPDGEKVEDYEWIEPEIKLDFVENIGFRWNESAIDFPKNISQPNIEDFTDGNIVLQGHTNKDHVFFGEEKWALCVPNNALLDQNGNPYNGTYSIKIKCMFAPEHLLAYSPNLVTENFGSKARLNASIVSDIQLFAGNQILNLKPGYFMQLAFVGHAIDSAQFFAFRKNKFVGFYDYDYEFSDDKLQNIPFYEFHHGNKTANFVATSDKTNLDDKFEIQGYQYLLNPTDDKIFVTEFQKYLVKKVHKLANEKGVSLKKGSNLIGLKHFIANEKSEKGIYELQVYDKEKRLFPELNAFKDYPLVFQTAFSKKDVNLLFFKAMKFHDIRIREFGGHWVLELKNTEGIWQIQLFEPKDRYKEYPSKAKSEQGKFLKRMALYQKLRNQKNQALNNIQNLVFNKEIENTMDKVYGSANPGKNKMKSAFLMRSTGRFAWAKTDSMVDVSELQVIPCEPGKIPLKMLQFQIVGNKFLSSITFPTQERYAIPMDLNEIQYLVCKDVLGRVYVLTGEKFRKLNIEKNTLTYIDFEPLPFQNWNQESLFNYLNKRRK